METKLNLNAEQQRYLAKILVKNSMYSGIGACIAEAIDREEGSHLRQLMKDPALDQEARFEAHGVMRDPEADGPTLRDRLSRGYWLCNYKPGEISLFYPSKSGGGICTYIAGPWADALGREYDSWNFEVHQRRATDSATSTQE